MTRVWVGRVLTALVSLGSLGATPRVQGPFVDLEDGRVLAVGGGEVYEPQVGGWRATVGAMHTSRRHPAAVVLTDGRVLVVGGASAGSGALASAEVYEPATGRWTPVAELLEAREDPAAVVLADGRVLVVGGFDGRRQPVRSAEVFDPVRGGWTRTGAPSATRHGARTGVVLDGGQALFVSGLQAELYEPASGTWSKAGPVGGAAGTHRSGHTVTRLRDGRVLVVGGVTARAAATAEVYEPETGQWRLVVAPGTPREAHAARVMEDGRVLVVGGSHASTGALASVERYDPVADTWSEEPPLQEARRGAALLSLEEGAVRVVGGGLSPSERYVPERCLPLTCEAAGPVCGSLADGCGGTLTCGPCEEAPRCGEDGCGVERAGYDARLRVLRCDEAGVGCASGAGLAGRGPLGPEPHAPNTLGGTCGDGGGGVAGRDESLDALRVLTEDGERLASGKRVRVEATVWAYEDPETNRLDLYFAADARAPVWTHVATLKPEGSGARVLSATYVLPAGTLQAVRGVFRYAGSAEPCPGGVFDDVDDLVFTVR